MKRKGSSEIVAVVMLIVIFGVLALSVAGSIASQTKANTNAGLTKTGIEFEAVIDKIAP